MPLFALLFLLVALMVGAASVLTVAHARRQHQTDERLLAMAWLCSGFFFFYHGATQLGWLPYTLGWAYFRESLVFLFGPCIYLHARKATGGDFGRLPWPVHLIPSLGLGLVWLAYSIYLPADALRIVPAQPADGGCPNLSATLLRFFDAAQPLVYIIAAHEALKRGDGYRPSLCFSSRSSHQRFLWGLLLGSITCGVVGFASPHMQRGLFVLIGFVFVIHLGNTAWQTFRRPITASSPIVSAPAATPEPEPAPASEVAARDEVADALIIQSLDDLFADPEIYHDANLTLDKLAKRLRCGRNQLSRAINKNHHVNFKRFVNRHRIQSAKQALRAPDSHERSIADIAFAVGFNSLSSFNAAFRLETKMTPKEFRQRDPALLREPVSELG